MLLGLGHELGTGLELGLGLELGMGIDIVRQVNRSYMVNGLVGRSDMIGDKGGIRRMVRVHLERNTETKKKRLKVRKKIPLEDYIDYDNNQINYTTYTNTKLTSKGSP